jgi:adenylate cyclase
MNVEIERRFLVRVEPWSVAARHAKREHLVQAYLASDRDRTARIRLYHDRAVLTVKGPTVGGARAEIECDIAADAARAIFDARLHAGVLIEKTRSTFRTGDLTWEVDQFEGENAGLMIAEVELGDRSRSRAEWDARVDAEHPAWLGREITGEPRFSNGALAMRPFASWPAAERDDIMREIEAGAA